MDSVFRYYPLKDAILGNMFKQATADPGVLFEFKQIGLIHERAENKICQAKAKIESVVTKNRKQEG